MTQSRDHGGNLDAAVRQYGGQRGDWIDLSTGINPCPYPVRLTQVDAWSALPDRGAMDQLIDAARAFWNIPTDAAVLAAPGCSALIAQIPTLWPANTVAIPGPTYNEHGASFRFHGWQVTDDPTGAACSVIVHPNNPTGAFWQSVTGTPACIIDESFCDVAPDKSLIHAASQTGHIVLKSFGKFWGLAGARLGFAIGPADLIEQLRQRIGPWAVSGPALDIGTQALSDLDWADQTRARLAQDAQRLDQLMAPHSQSVLGTTPLFRTYQVQSAAALQDRLARHHIWSRVFPYDPTWIRLGLPAPEHWDRVRAAL